MSRSKEGPSKYRCFFPLLISIGALVSFLPVYDLSLGFCDDAPLWSRQDCVSSVTFYVSWGLFVPFISGILAFAYRFYSDWCSFDHLAERRNH